MYWSVFDYVEMLCDVTLIVTYVCTQRGKNLVTTKIVNKRLVLVNVQRFCAATFVIISYACLYTAAMTKQIKFDNNWYKYKEINSYELHLNKIVL